MISRLWSRLAAERLRPADCIYGIALVGVVTVIGEIIPTYVRPTHLALMYLLAVLVMAVRFGLWPALIAAVLSVGALDYLFLQPLYTFEVNTPQDALLLAFLSVGAIIASGLAARLREQVSIAEQNAETTAALCQFAGKLAGTVTLDAAVGTVIDQVSTMLQQRATIVLADEKPASEASLTLPLRSSGESVGRLALSPNDDAAMTAEQLRVLEALAELAGIAIGRQVLADRLAQLGIEQAADRLRSALLNSIAHDLTAPIASVATALTSLAENYDGFDDTTRRELITEAEHEAERLHQFSANLIHIARLESGVLELKRSPTDIGELVDMALIRARHVLEPREIVADIPSRLRRPRVDFVLIEQAIFHVLENAGKYTPPDSTVTVTAEAVPGGVAIKIADEGPGFPAADSEKIFTKFYRASSAKGRAGTGLGLAICRGFIEAHGGTITASNRPDRSGALFTIVLPLDSGAVDVLSEIVR
jgi:two-component system, OmpR family, sensor histidine kinase KdpD